MIRILLYVPFSNCVCRVKLHACIVKVAGISLEPREHGEWNPTATPLYNPLYVQRTAFGPTHPLTHTHTHTHNWCPLTCKMVKAPKITGRGGGNYKAL